MSSYVLYAGDVDIFDEDAKLATIHRVEVRATDIAAGRLLSLISQATDLVMSRLLVPADTLPHRNGAVWQISGRPLSWNGLRPRETIETYRWTAA